MLLWGEEKNVSEIVMLRQDCIIFAKPYEGVESS